MKIRFSNLKARLQLPSLLLLLLASPLLMSHDVDTETGSDGTDSLVIERIERERAVQGSRSVLLAHKRNYFLPVTYVNKPNNEPITNVFGGDDDTLDNAEASFQLSLKSQLTEGLFTESGALYLGFTVRSFWQVFNDDISAPFRETNYEPELFWLTPVPWEVFGSDGSVLALGFVHQSNGRSQLFSRSWNRLYANLIWENNGYVFSFKPWWRIPEDEKDDPSDSDGDDNPDIEDFLGNFELTAGYRRNHHEYSMMLRNNLKSNDNHGAIQLDWSFPLHRRLRGYAQLFSGYGESLIDYDARIERIGIGILLSDLL
jgi:phospholipase A1